MDRKNQSLRDKLATVMQEQTGLPRREANRLVRTLLGTIVTHVSRNERTEIRGFGSFRWVLRKARKFKSGLFGNTKVAAYRHLTFHSKAMKVKR